jgi:hypothetical protein
LSIIFYWGLALIIGFLACYSVNCNRKVTRRVTQVLVIFIPSFFASIRYSSGTDTLGVYKPIFEEIFYGKSTVLSSRMETGYWLLNKLIASFGNFFPAVLFISCAITVAGVYTGLVYYKKYLNVGIGMWTFMMLFYQLSFNAIRQMISIAIFFYAIKYIGERKYVKSIVSILVAIMFHKIATVYFVIVILHSIFENKDKKLVRYILFILLFLVILNFSTIQQIFMKYNFFGDYAKSYLRTVKTKGLTIGFFIRTIPFLIPIVYLKDEIKESKYFQLIYNLTVVGSILRLFAYVTNTYAERIAYNFLIFQVPLVAIYIVNMKKYNKLISALLILFIAFLSYYDYFYLGIHQTVPYTTIFGR